MKMATCFVVELVPTLIVFYKQNPMCFRLCLSSLTNTSHLSSATTAKNSSLSLSLALMRLWKCPLGQ